MALELPWVETIMFPYNIVEDQAKELIHACAEKSIGFIAMKPLAGGAIEDAVTALRYVCSNPDVTVVIPGMADIAELNQNLAAVNDSSRCPWKKKPRCAPSAMPLAHSSAAGAITASRAVRASAFPACSCLKGTCPGTGWRTGREAAMQRLPKRHRSASAAAPVKAAAPTICPSAVC